MKILERTKVASKSLVNTRFPSTKRTGCMRPLFCKRLEKRIAKNHPVNCRGKAQRGGGWGGE